MHGQISGARFVCNFRIPLRWRIAQDMVCQTIHMKYIRYRKKSWFSELDDKRNSLGDAVSSEHYLYIIARLIMIPPYSQTTVLLRCQGFGLMKIKIKQNIVKPQCPRATRRLKRIPPETFASKFKFDWKARELTKNFMLFISPNSPTFMVHALGNEPPSLETIQ